MESLTLKVSDARNLWERWCGQKAQTAYKESGRVLVAFLVNEQPSVIGILPCRRLDPCIELNVLAQVELVAHELNVLQGFCLGREGFGKWIGAFSDTYTDRAANKLYSDFMAQKIRERVHDPETAESLVPKDHGFGTRRLPLESGYFEAFNQPHINLVDLKKTPIERVTESGIITSDGTEHKLDILIFATGFDAITGAFSAIEWHAKNGKPLLGASDSETGKQAIWVDHRPNTFLGMTVPDMPNMSMVLGPHQPFGNATRSIEHAVEVVTELLEFCKEKGYTYFEPTPEAADAWTEHVVECSKGALSNEVDSWMTGVNKNVKGKTVRSVARYSGSAAEFRRRCEESRSLGWKGLNFA